MENIKFQKIMNEQGFISGLEVGGVLVLDNSQQFKQELVGVIDRLSENVEITISELEDIDISCIQLFVAFIRSMDKLDLTYHLIWKIEEDQKQLLESIGLSNDFFLNN